MTHDNDDIDFEPAPPDKLYAHNRRQLSAMLDGELSPDQARFMLRRLQHDGELAACWERWQVSGDLLRGRGHVLLPADFSKRVAAGIAGSGDVAAARVSGAGLARPRQQRLLRWGGGALAASVALVALFMARQMPDPQAPELAEAGSGARSTPALVQAASPVELADVREAAPAAPAPLPDSPTNGAGLLAAAAPVAVAAAEVPRRAAARSSTRSQAQRAAARRAQTASEAPLHAVAAARGPALPGVATLEVVASPADSTVLPLLAGLPAAAPADGEALFGGLPDVATRPWPRATLPGLSGGQPFAAGYGLPQAEAFAPFQPRLGRRAFAPATTISAEQDQDAGTGDSQPGPAASDPLAD